MIVTEPAKRVGRSLMAWDPGAAQPVLALRSGLGIVVTLAAILALDTPAWSSAAVFGTWAAGLPSIATGVRARASLPVLTGLAVGTAVALGGLTEPYPAAALTVAAAWGLTMAFIGSLSGALGIVTTVCGVALVLAPDLVAGSHPLIAGTAAVAGGLVQCAASLLPPWQRFREERSVISGVYRSLAGNARALADAMNTNLATDELVNASTEINGRRRLPEVMRESVAALYELQAAIIAVAAARARLLNTDPTAARHTGAVLRDTASTLEILATSVDKLDPLSVDWEDRLAAAVDAAPVDVTGDGTARHSMAGREVRRLHRAVHKVARLTERIVDDEPPTTVASRPMRIRNRAAEDWQSLRSQLTWRSPILRHAVRAGVVIAIATAAGRLWPGDHGYWITLTAWVVLKPDFAATIGRGMGRALGTAGGVFIASLLSIALLSVPAATAPMIAAFALLGYFTLPVSFVIYSGAVAGFAVFQIDLAGQPVIDAAWERGVATLVGGVLALLLYTLWPTWQTRRLPELLEELLVAYRDHADLILDMLARPTEHDSSKVRAAVDELRLRRATLAVAVDQAAAEPIGGPRPYSSDVLDIQAALSRASKALIVLEGAVRHRDAAQLFGVDEFRDVVHDAYTCLADRVRGGQPRPVDLNSAQQNLDTALSKGTPATIRRRRLLDWESDILVAALTDADLIAKEWQR